jgi:hypothetical protein
MIVARPAMTACAACTGLIFDTLGNRSPRLISLDFRPEIPLIAVARPMT